MFKGWNELKNIAKDDRNAFPHLMGNTYSPEKFLFAHTDYQRTEASYKALVEGLFGDGACNRIDPPKPSWILQVFRIKFLILIK